MSVKTNKEWFEKYFTVTSSGVLILKPAYKRYRWSAASSEIDTLPETTLVIPRELPCLDESEKHKAKRIKDEQERITKKYNKKVVKGEMTKEEAEEKIKEEFAAIPDIPYIQIKTISENSGFQGLNRLFKERFRKDIESIIGDVEDNLYYETAKGAIDILIDKCADSGKISAAEADELHNIIPDKKYYKDNFINLVYDFVSSGNIDIADAKTLENILNDESRTAHDLENEIGALASSKKIDWPTRCNLLRNSPGAFSTYYSISGLDWFERVCTTIYGFNKIEFEETNEEPSPFTSFKGSAFDGLYIDSIQAPSRLKSIGEYAFQYSHFKEFFVKRYILKGSTKKPVLMLDKKSYACFRDCKELESLEIGSETIQIPDCMCLGCTNLKEHEYPANTKCIGKAAYQDCTSFDNKDFPASLEEIKAHAFSNSGMSGDLVIPDSIKLIGADAFSGTNIESVTVRSTKFNYSVFANCENLKTFTFDKGCAIADFRIFNNNKNLETINISSDVKEVKINQVDCIPNTTKIIFNGTRSQFLNMKCYQFSCPAEKIGDYNNMFFDEHGNPRFKIEFLEEKSFTESMKDAFDNYEESKSINELENNLRKIMEEFENSEDSVLNALKEYYNKMNPDDFIEQASVRHLIENINKPRKTGEFNFDASINELEESER